MVAPEVTVVKPAGVGGWLLVLCALLLLWQPASLGLVAAGSLDALEIRGVSLALLLGLRLLVAALGIAAGLALAARRTGAVTLAKVSLGVSAAADVFVYTTPYFPNNRMPGQTPFYVAASLAYAAIWITYLSQSARVRNTFSS